MRNCKISFLFFWLTFSLILFTNVGNLLAQETVDSLSYYSQLALKPQNANDLLKADEYFNDSYKAALKEDNIPLAINYLYYKASIETKSGENYKSEETLVLALKHLDELGESQYINNLRLSIYTLMGILYKEQRNKPKALELYYRALEIVETAKDSIIIYNNISNVYKNHNENEKARKELLKAKSIFPKLQDKLIKALVLDNLGFLNAKLNPGEGLSLIIKALELRKTAKDTSTIYTSYSHLAQYYNGIGDKIKSRKYSLKANDLANHINSLSYRNDALGLLTEISNDRFAVEYKNINDSLSKTKSETSSRFAFIKYDYEKQEKIAIENELKFKESELKNEQQKSKTTIAFSIASFITLLSLFLYFILKSKHKKDKIREAYLKEIELSKKVHDELANDMSDLMSLVENDIEITKAKKSLLLDNIEDIYLRTRDISTETGSIDLINFSDSIKHLLIQHNQPDTKVVINDINSIDWQSVANHKKIIVFRCLQELMVNMKKHSQAKVVSIVFKEHNNKKEIRYVDDGIGFVNEEVKLNGILNVESRIKGIGGSFNFTTSKGNGFKATLELNS